MFKTDNMILDHAARNLCRKLRESQTSAELKFWERVKSRKFRGLKFYRQFPIFYQINNHESFFIADFFCFEKKTVIEIDGRVHDIRKMEDEERSTILKNLGLSVIRIKNEEIEFDMIGVFKKLSLFLDS